MHVRWTFPVLALLMLTSSTDAQLPEHVYSTDRRPMPIAYYRQQAGLWKAVLDKTPTNADAWLNYYMASRNAYVLGQEAGTINSGRPQRSVLLDTIVQGMAQHVPGTFAYDLVKWENGDNDPALLPCLEKAHALAPRRPEPYRDLIPAYERMGRDSLRDVLCKEYLQLRDLPPGLLNYGYNLLAGTQPDAVLFTPGGDIGLAVLLTQHGMGIREDVHVLDLDLLQAKDYRERSLRNIRVPPPDLDPLSGGADLSRFQRHIIADVATALPDRPIYVSLSAEVCHTRPVQDALHLTGLAYRYSTAPFDPLPELIDNYTSRYALFDLTHPAGEQGDTALEMVHRSNADYLPSLFAIIDHYATAGDEAATGRFKALARQVAADAGRSGEFTAHFAR